MTEQQASGAETVDDLAARVAATAISAKRTVFVQVNALGFVCGVVLKPEARNWDAVTLNNRVRKVAAVAHDRYLANLGIEGTYPTLDAVAAAERALAF
ncbi:hypothetical protein [Mycobacterium sp. SMC-4]|uniref:hypothetical protein n=1 Tax=Mycobacterium sp. SMC-4 TaxID=2857059 RepID=UPI001F1CF6FE|nr:hypothetical protein [Mycobacterium sp. SMC-4]MCF6389977.1 hypothetical protein [Mycobacterium sp. MBM]UXA21295.1 hypothetical protein KXD98_27755 [Mycobacterium sp. SMC-4]